MATKDRTLVTRALRGNREAFEELVERYQRIVHAIAISHTGDSAAAEDATQSTFLEAFLSLRTLRERDKFKPWLLGIARNVANSQQRRESRMEPGLEINMLIDGASLPDEVAEKAELRAFVMNAVQSLGEIQREAVMLHYVQGLSYEEIAKALDIPRSTVVGRLQTARAQLRGDLEGVIEEVLQGERPKDDLKERVVAALPITLFKKGSLFGAALLGSRSAMTLAVSTTAAVIGTAFTFSVFSGLLDHDAQSAIETTTPVRVELSDRSQPENESAGTKGDGPALTVEDSRPRKQEAKPQRPTIGVAGSATDPVIVISYEVPEESDVEITIRDRVGTVVAVPVLERKTPGKYSVSVSKASWPQSYYHAGIMLDNNRKRRRSKLFEHHKPGVTRVYNKDLQELQSQAMVSTRMDPERSVQLWDKLLTEHPDYLARGSAFLYSIMALLRVSDSSRVHTHIDSAVNRIPGFWTYNQISRFTAGLEADPRWNLRLYPETALRFAHMSVKAAERVPEPHRDGDRLMARESLTRALLISGDYEGVEDTARESLEIHRRLPEGHRRSGSDKTVYRDLGIALSRQGRYEEALGYLKRVLPHLAYDPSLWEETQRAYAGIHANLEGWDRLKGDIETQIPEKYRAQLNASNVGRPFPDFSLKTIDGRAIGLADLKGNISVVNFWQYWCGPCVEDMRMLQILADEFGGDVRFLGVHRGGPFGQKDGHVSSIRKVLEKSGASYPMTLDYDKLHRRVNARTVPATFVLDAEGTIRLEVSSYRPKDSEPKIRSAIERLLKTP